MRTLSAIALFLFLPFSFVSCQSDPPEDELNWTQWRGPYETGVAPAGNPPLEWSETKNVKWKTEIPGIGHATPIILGDQMILLSAVPTDKRVEKTNAEANTTSTDFIHKFTVISVDRASGEIQWQTVAREEVPFSGTHEFGSWASNSPVTDGEHIYAYFGSYGLYCLDLKGKILWERDFGRMQKRMDFGEGSSPYLYKDKLVILRDHQGQSSIHVMDKKTGDILWEANRDEISSWSTPTVIETDGTAQLITSATGKVKSYDIQTGKVLWECSGMTENVIPSPVYANGILIVMSGFRGNAILAIDLSKAKGNITGSDAIVWSYGENTTPYTPSPVLMDNRLYFLKANNGYISCLDARDGKEYFVNQRLEGIKNIFTSPVGVGDRIYVVGTNGVTCVIRNGESFELLAENTLDENFYASPVIVGNDLYLRGDHALYCISAE